MKKRKVCVVVTARASYSRIRSALFAIRAHKGLELQLVCAASLLMEKYGRAIEVIRADGFEVAAKVNMIMEGNGLTAMPKSTGIGLIEFSTVFDTLRPDIVVSIADRFETIATAITASYMNIPLAQVQGGEITGSIDEKVRHAVTKLANIHFASTRKAAERIIRMGEPEDTVFNTGCPSIDIAAEIMATPGLDFDPYAKYGGVGAAPDLSDGYHVVMQHPVTTEVEAAQEQVKETLYAVNESKYPTLWFWPNVDAGSDGISKGIRTFREQEDSYNVHFFKNMTPRDFLRLLYNSRGIIGNSSVAIRECSFLGVPAINIGSRQQGRERGKNVMDVGYDREEILTAMKNLSFLKRVREPLYGDGKAGIKIADYLSSVPLTIEKRLTY